MIENIIEFLMLVVVLLTALAVAAYFTDKG